MGVSANAIDQERLQELRSVLGKLDPAGKREWLLEVYDRDNGVDRLVQVINIKTGRKRGRPRKEQG